MLNEYSAFAVFYQSLLTFGHQKKDHAEVFHIIAQRMHDSM